MRNLHSPGRSNVLGTNGMAATSQPLSSLEAISILKKGGNAVDAAIAASIALPPFFNIDIASRELKGCEVAAIPLVPKTFERPEM